MTLFASKRVAPENIADETTVCGRERSLSCVAPHSMGRWDKVAARTDNDITDDATGLARIEMAAASKARKQAEELEMIWQSQPAWPKLHRLLAVWQLGVHPLGHCFLPAFTCCQRET